MHNFNFINLIIIAYYMPERVIYLGICYCFNFFVNANIFLKPSQPHPGASGWGFQELLKTSFKLSVLQICGLKL